MCVLKHSRKKHVSAALSVRLLSEFFVVMLKKNYVVYAAVMPVVAIRKYERIQRTKQKPSVVIVLRSSSRCGIYGTFVYMSLSTKE